jgi:predicted dehydrogenase
MKDKIQVCIIGAGRAGMLHAANFRSRVPFARLVAIVDPIEKTAAVACKKLGIDRSYLDFRDAVKADDIDAVVITAPTEYHKEIAIGSAVYGKHILCEKPMAIYEDECDQIIRIADERKVHFQIGFMRRFDENYQNAKKMVDFGEVGEVVMVRSNTRGPSVPRKWMYDIEKSNGPLAEVNSHDIDTLRWFTGSEFSSIYAIGGNFRCPDAREGYPDFYDNVVMMACFRNGMQGCIDGAQGVAYGYDARTEILGTHGCIFIGYNQNRSLALCTSRKKRSFAVKNWQSLFSEAYLQEDIHFIRSILEGFSPIVSGIDGKMAVRVVNAGNQSIKEKRIIDLV